MDTFIRTHLETQAQQLGLRLFGIVDLQLDPLDYSRFNTWLEEGNHAEMEFLTRHKHLRETPSLLLEGAQSALVLGLPYFLGDKLSKVKHSKHPQFSQYARMRDYHKEIRQKCQQLVTQMNATWGGNYRICIDSAPLLERALAKKTAKGFIGKNTLYIHPQHGSFFLLGEILTTLQLPSDKQTPVDPTQRDREFGGCGSCKRCQVHCPTGALDTAFQIDARKCLAYHTIENRGTIPVIYWKWLKTYLFGCDLCQLACPYNRHAQAVRPSSMRDWSQLALLDIVRMSQAEYEAWFGGTPVTRAKISGLKRNALIAMIVADDPSTEDARTYARASEYTLLHQTLTQENDYRKHAMQQP
ncbi:MAG: tRNA epoxyqueuosine(34) reductase QueG [Zetaproteobacteria bacterium]|nr:tRNA epoxyqueuosine(34) reductase QueG [Zetaproteobacteria bacterium]